jgi:hypothetical protein
MRWVLIVLAEILQGEAKATDIPELIARPNGT